MSSDRHTHVPLPSTDNNIHSALAAVVVSSNYLFRMLKHNTEHLGEVLSQMMRCSCLEVVPGEQHVNLLLAPPPTCMPLPLAAM